MSEEPVSQRQLHLRPDFRWGVILGFPLGILFALVFYFGWGSSTSSPNVVTEQDNLLLEYGLLIFLFFFVVGILRGRLTRSIRSAVNTAISA